MRSHFISDLLKAWEDQFVKNILVPKRKFGHFSESAIKIAKYTNYFMRTPLNNLVLVLRTLYL